MLCTYHRDMRNFCIFIVDDNSKQSTVVNRSEKESNYLGIVFKLRKYFRFDSIFFKAYVNLNTIVLRSNTWKHILNI